MKKANVSKSGSASALHKYKVPVIWTMTGYIEAQGENEHQAIEQARKTAAACSLNDVSEAEYLSDSFTVLDNADALIPVIDN